MPAVVDDHAELDAYKYSADQLFVQQGTSTLYEYTCTFTLASGAKDIER